MHNKISMGMCSRFLITHKNIIKIGCTCIEPGVQGVLGVCLLECYHSNSFFLFIVMYISKAGSNVGYKKYYQMTNCLK